MIKSEKSCNFYASCCLLLVIVICSCLHIPFLFRFRKTNSLLNKHQNKSKMIPRYMLRQIAEDETLPKATREAAAKSIAVQTVSSSFFCKLKNISTIKILILYTNIIWHTFLFLSFCCEKFSREEGFFIKKKKNNVWWWKEPITQEESRTEDKNNNHQEDRPHRPPPLPPSLLPWDFCT